MSYHACRHAFGVRGGIRDSVSFTSDVMLIHPVGQHVALYNTESKSCSFLQKPKDVVEVRVSDRALPGGHLATSWILHFYSAL